MISDKEITHIAKLARLKLTDEEQSKFKKELSSVLEYVEQLNKLDTENVPPLAQTTGIVNAFREDAHRGDFRDSDELHDKLVGQAPHKEGRFVKVKQVISK